MSETKALATVPPKTYALTQYDEAQLKEVVEINLGGEQSITEFDLTRIKIPSGGGIAFNVESADGADSSKDVTGVVVAHQTRRAYWEKAYGEGEDGGGPPDCWSPDGVTGYGTMAAKCGGKCASCPMAQFGSAKDKGGKPAKGQACAQKRALFVMDKDSILPAVVSLPPTSLQPFKAFLTNLISKRLPITGVVTKITLKKEKNSGGTEYAECVFAAVGALSPEETKIMTGYGKMFGTMFRPTPPNAAEMNRPGNDTKPAGDAPPPNVPGWTPAPKKPGFSGEEANPT